MSLIRSIERVRAEFARRPTRAPPDLDLPDQRVLLVYLFGGMGDAALLAPAVSALLARGPASPVGLVLRPLAARLWRRVDLPVRIHEVSEALIAHDAARMQPDRAPKRTPAVLRQEKKALASALSRRHYDVAVDLTLKAGIDARQWLDAAGAEVRVGWLAAEETPESVGLTWGMADLRTQTDRHWSQACAAPLACFGVDASAAPVEWRTTARADATASKKWGPRPRLLLVPGSQSADKQWAPEAFGRAGKALAARRGGSAIVTGAPWESALMKRVAAQIGPAAQTFTGRDLATLIAIIRTADLVLTNDTGPMHLAFMLGVPTVAVFLHMPPSVWGPSAPDPRFVVLEHPSRIGLRAAADWDEHVSGQLDALADARGFAAR